MFYAGFDAKNGRKLECKEYIVVVFGLLEIEVQKLGIVLEKEQNSDKHEFFVRLKQIVQVRNDLIGVQKLG